MYLQEAAREKGRCWPASGGWCDAQFLWMMEAVVSVKVILGLGKHRPGQVVDYTLGGCKFEGQGANKSTNITYCLQTNCLSKHLCVRLSRMIPATNGCRHAELNKHVCLKVYHYNKTRCSLYDDGN